MSKDQAAHLRHKVEKNNQSSHDHIKSYPPRREIHQHKKNKTKWKISFPLIRLLLLVFIVIIILFLTFKYWGEPYLSTAETETIGDTFDQVELKMKKNDQIDYKIHVD